MKLILEIEITDYEHYSQDFYAFEADDIDVVKLELMDAVEKQYKLIRKHEKLDRWWRNKFYGSALPPNHKKRMHYDYKDEVKYLKWKRENPCPSLSINFFNHKIDVIDLMHINESDGKFYVSEPKIYTLDEFWQKHSKLAL